MLKTRNLIFTLSLSPLLSFAWQLPNQAQSFSPSKGTAGVDAGAATGASQTSGFSTPTGTTQATTQATTTAGTPVTIPIEAGVEITIVTGVSTDGKLSVATTTVGDTDATVAVTAATVESTSSSVTVTDGATANTVVITLAPQSQVVVNQLAAAIVQNLNSIISGGTTGGGTTGGGTADVATLLTGGAGSQQAAVALTNSFTAAGISPQLATALVTSLTGLFASNTGSLPNQPVALTTSGQIVASAKAFKPVTIIAQGVAGLSVNINQLNDAIVAYNRI
ncbi:MAG: hypothetical protein ACLBM4_07465, partial [Dolichospermum sp.]